MTFLNNILNRNYSQSWMMSSLRNVGYLASGGTGRAYVFEATLEPGRYRAIIGHGVSSSGTNDSKEQGKETVFQRFNTSTNDWESIVLCNGGTTATRGWDAGSNNLGGTLSVHSAFSVTQIFNNAINGSYKGQLSSGYKTLNSTQPSPISDYDKATSAEKGCGGNNGGDYGWNTCKLASTKKTQPGCFKIQKIS